MTTSIPNKINYDPAYCLAEHLNYFSENVATNLSDDDFDVIFSSSNAAYLAAPSPPTSGKHIFIEKVYILPNMPDILRKVVAKGSSNDTLPPRVTSATPTIPQSPNLVPPSPTTPVKQPMKIADISIPVHVPDPLLQASASDAARDLIVPCPITSSAPANPVPSSPTPCDQIQIAIAPAPAEATPPVEPTVSETPSAPAPVAPAAPACAPVISDDDDNKDQESTTPEEKPSRKRRMSHEDSKDVRRERNRKHAKKSRQRKKEFNQALNESIDALKAENEWLRSIMNISKETILAPKPEPEEEEPQDLVAALQNPKNRVLSDFALASLQNMFHSPTD